MLPEQRMGLSVSGTLRRLLVACHHHHHHCSCQKGSSCLLAPSGARARRLFVCLPVPTGHQDTGDVVVHPPGVLLLALVLAESINPWGWWVSAETWQDSRTRRALGAGISERGASLQFGVKILVLSGVLLLTLFGEITRRGR